MVPMARLLVVTVGGAERVSMEPPKLVPAPTASQFAGPAQETPTREPIPVGTAWLVQLVAPSAVSRMLAAPTAVQLVALMQLTEERAVAPVGLPLSSHCTPPSVVEMTREPTATHVRTLEHEMPPRLLTSPGTDCGVQVLPPFVVLRTAATGPPDDDPTAVQWSVSTQEMDVKLDTVAGMCSDVHAVPPLVVTMMLGEPVPALKSLTA